MKTVRCAIYTRKSSEEGLDQAFNSLDAQREACAAYILSQASEGWVPLPDIYDDGGLSGGTLDRPALQRLLSEVKAGRVDTIVVYKVDRLTRSLMDFSKLVETFDKAGTSFVSVTQSFNTTTSMGRLTLNMLLSFAQFEREVTAERIRDKIAASKAKGMWMGGTPPIGYKPNGRSLEIVEDDARLIRRIFELYLHLGNVRAVTESLGEGKIWSPTRTVAKTGRTIGGVPLSRGQIYKILNNQLYVGIIEHKGQSYPALHDPIVERDLFDRVQALLAENLQGRRSGSRASHPSLLAGKVIDDKGEPLIPVHATKGATRYRYYVSQRAHHAGADGLRIPARELEALVIERVVAALADSAALAGWGFELRPSDYARISERGPDSTNQRGNPRGWTRAVVEQVRIERDRIAIDLSAAAIAAHLGIGTPDATAALTLDCDARLTRSGRVMKLVERDGRAVVGTPDPALIRLMAKAHRWWRDLGTSGLDVKSFARREGINPAYLSRVLRLVFLSPKVTEGILTGTAKGAGGTGVMTLRGAFPVEWHEQERMLLGPSR
jgi:DNA invertase Pin-like site-specific DNA recombinase